MARQLLDPFPTFRSIDDITDASLFCTSAMLTGESWPTLNTRAGLLQCGLNAFLVGRGDRFRLLFRQPGIAKPLLALANYRIDITEVIFEGD